MERRMMDIGVNKVRKIPVPLLVVGLGGTGKDAVIQIKKTFADNFVLPRNEKGEVLSAPEKTAYLVFDSEPNKPEELEVEEYVNIFFSGLDKILNNQQQLLTPYERTWVNPDLYVPEGVSMGMNRQEARLALSHNFDIVNNAIKGALQKIVSVTSGSSDSKVGAVEIVIVTSIGGGTGSGIFLDMCQIIRSAAAAVTVIKARLTGYIVMPDVNLARVSTADKMAWRIKCIAYAALKELDFWMRVHQHNTPYSMQYGSGTKIEWKEPPFNKCILMSSSNVEGIPYKDGYEAVMSTIAENLMHYMAEETCLSNRYSYCFEDVLPARAACVERSYPLYYGYRAIGAFTKRIPKKAILYYEGSLLLKTIVPMRDQEGKLQPDRRMFTDEQGKQRAEMICGNGPQLMQDFKTNVCRLPGFCNLDLKDKVKVEAVRNMNPPPHNKWHNWRDTVSSPAAIDAADKYLEKAWNRFEKWASEIMTDPEQGPFALEAYLESPAGLIGNLEETLTSWNAQYHKTYNQLIHQGEEMCNNSWGSFKNPPLLGKQGALEQYDHAIRSLYTYVNNCQFLEKHTEALEKLILRIKEYLQDGLKPLCATIQLLEKEFNRQETSDAVLVQDIYKLDTVQASIDAAFAKANANEELSSRFLGKIAGISLKTEKNVDSKTSGVTFICRRVGLNEMCKVIQSEMEETYGSVNNQSLDDIMIANVGDSVSAQEKWMSDLARSSINSALPMFMQDPVFRYADKAAYAYMSIPANAPMHLKYIGNAFRTTKPAVESKASVLDDHIFVLMGWDVLGLFRYGMFEELRKAYNDLLTTKNPVKAADLAGLHLVCSNHTDFSTDWSQLPSPKPYFLFPGEGVEFERNQYATVHDLVKRGLKCGMITVKDDVPYTEAEVNIFYSDVVTTVYRKLLQQEEKTSNCKGPETRNTYSPTEIASLQILLSSSELLQLAEKIRDRKNPETGDVCSDTEIAYSLRAMLDFAHKENLKEMEVRPEQIASALSLEREQINPFDPEIMADTTRLKTAQENHRKLCIAMTEVMIYTRPDLVRALQIQLPAYEKIYQMIDHIADVNKRWKKRNDFAETAANIFLFLNDAISLGGKEYKYKQNGNKYDILHPDETAEDVKKIDSAMLRAACFLADAQEDNAARAELTRMLTETMSAYDNAIINWNITEAEIDDYDKTVEELIDELKEDQITAEREASSNPGRKDELEPQIEMMKEMIHTLVGWKKAFTIIAKKIVG